MTSEPCELSELFAATDELLFLLAADGTIVYASPAAQRELGPGASAGAAFADLITAERRAVLAPMIEFLLGRPEQKPSRDLTLCLAENERLVTLCCSPARWKGEPRLLVFVREARDSPLEVPSAAQREALTHSEEFFHALFNSSSFLITISDARTGKLFDVNSAFERRTGVTRARAVGRSAEELGLLKAGVQDAYLRQLVTDGTTQMSLVPVLRAHGERATNMVCATVVEVAGAPLVFSIAFDVTELQRAQEELRLSDSKFRALFDNMVDAMFFIDRAGNFIELNAAACAQLGYTREELLTRSAWTVFGGAQLDFNEVASRLRETGQLSFESMQERRDGTRFPIGLTLAAIEYRGSTAIAGIGRDLTERKQREEELERTNDELMRFAYTVSHDLKSPLVTIKSFLGYLREDLAGRDAERVERDLAHIERAAQRMGSLLDDLLELSRIGRKVNPPERVELAQLVRSAGELVAGRLALAGAELSLQAPNVWLWGDRSRLLEVFQNLIDNAVKFAAPGLPPRITIDCHRQQGELVIAVRDNGIGIDPRHQHRLFGLFEKLHPHAEGTGIGLALVKRIVDVHGGRVWVESPGEGLGTAVCLVLPGTTQEVAR